MLLDWGFLLAANFHFFLVRTAFDVTLAIIYISLLLITVRQLLLLGIQSLLDEFINIPARRGTVHESKN